MVTTILSTTMATLSVKASYDTQHRLSYDPQNARAKPLKKTTPNNLQIQRTTVTLTASTSTTDVSELLRRNNHVIPTEVKSEESYMGYETWVPSPPKVKQPRSVYNAAALAYIGDCIYELYARRHFLFPPLNIEDYNDRVMAVVRCEAQDALLQKLINDDFLSKEERDILRWGKNIGSAKTRTIKRAGIAVYNRASSLETLIGHLYLTNVQRLDEIMQKLGFSTGDSSKLIEEEVNSEPPVASI